MWGSIGYGLTSFISGSVVNIYSTENFNYIPATIIMVISSVFDVSAGIKLKVNSIHKEI